MYQLFKCIKLFTLLWSEQMYQDIIDCFQPSPRCLCPVCPHVDRSSLDFSSMSLSCVSTCGPVISRLLLDVSVLCVHMWTGHLSTSPRCLCPVRPHVDRSSLDFSSTSLSCVSTCGPVISRLLLDVSVLCVHMWTGHLSTSPRCLCPVVHMWTGHLSTSPRCLCPVCPHVDRSSSRLLLDVSVLCVHMWTGHLSTSPRCLCPVCPHVDRSSLDFSSMSLSCVSTCGPVISRLLLDVSVLCVHMWTGHLSIADGGLTAWRKSFMKWHFKYACGRRSSESPWPKLTVR